MSKKEEILWLDNLHFYLILRIPSSHEVIIMIIISSHTLCSGADVVKDRCELLQCCGACVTRTSSPDHSSQPGDPEIHLNLRCV